MRRRCMASWPCACRWRSRTGFPDGCHRRRPRRSLPASASRETHKRLERLVPGLVQYRWNRLLNSITMVTVMALRPRLKSERCCGTPSSRTRKLPLGIPGMKWPLLSITATSTVTTSTSVREGGRGVSGGFVAGRACTCEGIFGSSEGSSFSGSVALRGRATVEPGLPMAALLLADQHSRQRTVRRRTEKRQSRIA